MLEDQSGDKTVFASFSEFPPPCRGMPQEVFLVGLCGQGFSGVFYHRLLALLSVFLHGYPALGVREPVVPWRVWISLMKLPEFLQTAYREVVEWLLRPVLVFRVVEPMD